MIRYIFIACAECPIAWSRCADADDAPDAAAADDDDDDARMGALDDITATSRVNSRAESRDDVAGAHETRVKTWMRVTARADDLNSNDATGPRARVEAFASEGDGGGDDDGVDVPMVSMSMSVKYAETIALLRAQTEALRASGEARDALERDVVRLEDERRELESDTVARMGVMRREMETLRETLEEVVASRGAARDARDVEARRADALEVALSDANDARARDEEAFALELAEARAEAEAAARVVKTSDGAMVTAEALEASMASEKKAKYDAQRARDALVEQKKTLDALEKRLRETRSRADLAEAKCRELKSSQKRWERLEATGDRAFAQSPASTTSPRTLRESHRNIRAYAANRVSELESDVQKTKREATRTAANLDARLAAEAVARDTAQDNLSHALSRIRELELERDDLRRRVEDAENDAHDLKLTLKLAEERAAQAEETAAKEMAVAMDAMDRVRAAENALDILSATATKRTSPPSSKLAEMRQHLARAEDRAEKAEKELASVRHAAIAARESVVESISPPRSTPPRVAERHAAAAEVSRPSMRLARPNPPQSRSASKERERRAANELLSSLRNKLEASSPAVRKRTHRDDPYATPTKA